jgi:hypothetical protein
MSVKAARRFYRVDSAHDLQFLHSSESASAENRWTFEIAWEVANKGIIFLDIFLIVFYSSFNCYQ